MSSSVSIDQTSEETIRTTSIQAAVSLYPEWRDAVPPVSPDEFTVTVVSGGITNQLYKVSRGATHLLVRKFGAKTELVIDRNRENEVVRALTTIGFGPRTYGNIANGRVEEFLEGKAMEPKEMVVPELVPLVGARLAELHAFHFVPSSPPTLWNTLESWSRAAMECDFSDNADRLRAFQALELGKLRDEMLQYRARLKESGMEDLTPNVFSHNDLLSGNIMVSRRGGVPSVTFIDYEYAAYNFRGFDIANHFAEMCGFDCVWEQYPSGDTQEAWFRGYLGRTLGQDLQAVDPARVEAMRLEVDAWSPAPHLFWSFWAVVQARHSPIDFDFMAFSAKRAEGFRLFLRRSLDALTRAVESARRLRAK